jgi:glycosyltransferase involved in cell wall biosynthesis
MWGAVFAAQDPGLPVIWYIHETLLLWRLLDLNPQIQPALGIADVLVFPTQRTAELYRPLTARPIEVFPYGIPAIKVSAKKRNGNRLHLVLLGSYEYRKGQDLFLNAIMRLPESVREKAVFEMVGRKLDAAFFESLAQQPRPANVKLSDALEHDEALALLAGADVLVCASRDETMPIAILEAMSLGKAIITTNVGGTTEWLRDGFNALIVPADDTNALGEAIHRCIESPELAASLGKNAQRTFNAEFSLDRLGKNFRRLIKRVLRERKS